MSTGTNSDPMIRVEELISSQVGLEFSPDEASKELPDDDEQALSTSLCSHGWAHPVGLAVVSGLLCADL